MPNTDPKTVATATADAPTVDGKALAIRLGAMVGVTAAAIAATVVVMKQINKGQED